MRPPSPRSPARRAPRARRRGAVPRSWVEQPFLPAIAVTNEQAALMEPVGAILPEFDPVGHHAVAAPMRRARHLATGEALLHLVETRLEGRARVERPRL